MMNLATIKKGYLAVSDRIYIVVRSLCKLLLLIMTLSVSYAFVGRFIIKKTPSWCEELGILCMVWVGLLSSALAIRDGIHIRMTVINYIFSDKVCKTMHFCSYVVLLILNIVWVKYGVQVISLTFRTKMTALQLPQSVLYGSVAVVGVIGIVMTLARMVKGEW